MTTENGPGRAKPRFLAALPASLRCGEKELPCEAFNLSRSGVLLIGNLPQPEEPDLEVRITTPSGDLELRALARVVHAQSDPASGESKLGLQFSQLEPAQNETIDLLVARIVEGMAPAALDTLPRGASATRTREALKKIPVPHRVALARRGQAREREILRQDPDPHVLDALARNPRITLPEIIALARLPHLLPSTIETMAADPRWKLNDEVRIMLATHPRASFATADRIVSGMSEVVLQRALHRPGLNPGVREKLMTRLSRKHRG
jgi:hypothetical protein